MNRRQMFDLSKSSNRGAVQITLLYLIIGGLWILLSDKIAARIALNEEAFTIISLYKGWGYIFVTALLLYWLIQRDTRALRASESQLQQVIDAMPVLIAYVGTDGHYRFANRTYEEWFGNAARGKTLQEVVGENAYQTISKYVDRALSGETVTYESAVTYPQGERFINATYIPDKTANGQVKGFFALVRDMTESRQTQEELRLWADAFNGCAHGIAIGNPETNRIVVCNPAFADMHKCRAEDITGSAILSLYAPADHEYVRRNIEEADRMGHVRYEAHMIRRDGSTFPVQIDVVSVRDDAGNILHRVATAQDITERKQAEEQSKSLARFPNENPNPVLRASLEGKILYANPASQLLLNDWHCQVGDDLPTHWIELIHAGTRKTMDVQCQDITYSIITAPIADANYVNLYGTDITERKRTETALLESMTQFRTLFEASPDAILLIDPRGNWPIMDCNTAACQMNGYTREELIGQSINSISSNPLPASALDGYLESIRQANVLRFETLHRRKDGTEFSIEVSNSLISLGGREVLLGIDRDITERKRAQDALHASEERYRAVVDNAMDAILVTDPAGTGRVLSANPAACNMFGYSMEEFPGLVREDILDTRDPNLAALLQRREQYGEATAELTYKRRDGSRFSGELSLTSYQDKNGENRSIAIIRDITERKQAEETRHRFELLSEHSRDIILFIRSEDRRILEGNAAALQSYGYRREELLALTIQDLRASGTSDLTDDQMNQAEAGGILFETVHRRKDGSTFPVEVSSQGAVIGGIRTLISIVRDISERKRAERELRESQVRLSFALEKSHTGGWDLDLVDHTALRTLEHDRIFGYESLLPQWTYEIFLDHVIPEDRAEVNRLFQEAITTQTNWSFECRIRRIDGQIRWIWAIGGHLFDEAGHAYRMAGIVQDITDRKQAEDEIRRLNEELEQRVIERTAQLESANKELEAFSYSVSHDLRAPLRAIDGYTRILMEDYETKLDAEGKRICGIISAEARRMGQLIDDLLAFSRLGRKEMFTSKIDMKALAVSVFDELAKEQDRARIDFQIAKLPTTRGDLSLMHQVWVNLLSNAIKFTSKKERSIIEVGGRQSREENIYYVRDTGAGFEMEYADKLFGVFQRLHGESEFEGTGVGLAIVQRIVRRHGGRVWAEGEPEKGATFYFSLPRKEGHQET